MSRELLTSADREGKPKWQKARILIAAPRDQHLKGRTLWVAMGPPLHDKMVNQFTGVSRTGEFVLSNLTYFGEQMFQPLQALELLPEFADEVEFQEWNVFAKKDYGPRCTAFVPREKP